MDSIVISSQGKTYAYNFVYSMPSTLRGIRRLYLQQWAFKDLAESSSHTGSLIVEIRPIVFTTQSGVSQMEGRLVLPATYGSNIQVLPQPLLVADSTKQSIPPLTELQVKVFTGSGVLNTNLSYLHLWFVYEK